MSIELRCESCGRRLKAPRESAGKRSKCPACDHELYIPTPEDEIEEVPLAPEDAADREREAALQAERRRLDWEIAQEEATASSEGSGAHRPARPSGPGDAGGPSIQEMVVAYLAAMRDSDLARADQLLPVLKRRRSDVLQVLDQLAADQIPPAQLANVPSGVYQGFLKNLRSQV